jgi:hypothetical protein
MPRWWNAWPAEERTDAVLYREIALASLRKRKGAIRMSGMESEKHCMVIAVNRTAVLTTKEKAARLRDSRARYEKSAKGGATRARWRSSPRGRAKVAAYNARYRNSPKGSVSGKAARRRYYSKPEVKEQHRWYMRSWRRKRKILSTAI